MFRIAPIVLPILLAAAPAFARDPVLKPPLDCDLAQTCFIPRFVDVDPGPGRADFRCGPLTGDGHKGTDFAVPTAADMNAGVEVLPVAPGTVRAIRDGVPDTGNGPETEGQECGNGIVINHGGGWETQYCHLKQGSIAVRKGQRVRLSTVLGEVGFSGQTSFPHVHLSVRKEGEVIDPFAPDARAQCGEPEDEGLWSVAPPYRPGGLIAAGFADDIPEYDDVRAGEAAQDHVASDAGALVIWVYAFSGRTGDVLEFKIFGPDGRVIESAVEIKKPQALYFRAVGRRTPATGWPEGLYEGHVTLKREGIPLETRSVDVTVSP